MDVAAERTIKATSATSRAALRTKWLARIATSHEPQDFCASVSVKLMDSPIPISI
jgi:hypothetical protein